MQFLVKGQANKTTEEITGAIKTGLGTVRCIIKTWKKKPELIFNDHDQKSNQSKSTEEQENSGSQGISIHSGDPVWIGL